MGERGEVLLETDFYLDSIGTVTATLTQQSLLWECKMEEDMLDAFVAPCWKCPSQPSEFRVADIYAVENSGLGSVKRSIDICKILKQLPQMHRFVVHTFDRSNGNKWNPRAYTFGHSELEMCLRWVSCLQSLLSSDLKRPKNLLVLVNPYGGKGAGRDTWEMVAPLFRLAFVRTKVIQTERRGHASDMFKKSEQQDLQQYEGIVIVGGDGLFNEVLNGLATRYHIPSSAPNWTESSLQCSSAEAATQEHSSSALFDSQPLLQHSSSDSASASCSHTEKGSLEAFLNEKSPQLVPWLRLGIIPAGSTDTILVSTTGTRDPFTAALHILLGDSMSLDVARIIGKRRNIDSRGEDREVRYAASFAGYGFYGDVAKESEMLRWMGPARYDYAGFKVFMKHRKYEAEVCYLEISGMDESSKKSVCRTGCRVCLSDESIREENIKWRRKRGYFHSIGAAIMSCRNDKSPDGLVAHAHLADGMLHLILIKECSRAAYLRQLIELTRKDANPFGFNFVEHHSTPMFTFVSHGEEESVWNVDGEILRAYEISAQVCRGLIKIFGCGPQI